ncbi:uncharacterized protein LOC141906196 [Tubulanus polymorphus]|uniref:uncharacterized protein LOC141906196 n=1 Tax=Tubulanus polymorphus TaxID=672921 RepID=UPI003DA260AD
MRPVDLWYPLLYRLPRTKAQTGDVSDVAAEANRTRHQEHDVAIPNDFDSFDIDEDEKISMEEFAAGMSLDDDDARYFIHQADNDEDSFIDREEFKHAPWPFQEKNDVESCDCKKP